MSLAENLLNSLDETAYQNSRIAGIQPEEEHIIVGQDRTITVPTNLKTIAVKGDKDIETVTFDCVRYWDGHDLSTFAIYINYILPQAEEETTYIPKEITKFEDTFSFDWTIGREITSIEGSLKFWIVAKLTDDEGNLIKQWSSLQNSDCTIAPGGDKIYVPEVQTDKDVISQAIAVSRASAERAEAAADRIEINTVLDDIDNGEGKESLIVMSNDKGEMPIATGDYSIGIGTDDTSVLGDLEDIAKNEIEPKRPEAKGDLSLSYGFSTVANSAGSHAVGFGTTAGIFGYYWYDITQSSGSSIVTLSYNQRSLEPITSINDIDWAEGDYISIVNNQKYAFVGTITKKELVSRNSKMTVAITINTIKFGTNAYSGLSSLILSPDDKTIFAVSRKLNSLTSSYVIIPKSGTVELAWGATAYGLNNLCAGTFGVVRGANNVLAGDFGAIFGRDNLGAYGDVIGGGWNESTGLHSGLFGRLLKNYGDYNMQSGYHNQIHQGNYNMQSGAENNHLKGNGNIEGGYNNTIDESTYSVIGGNNHKIAGDQDNVSGKGHILGDASKGYKAHYSNVSGEGNTLGSERTVRWNNVSGKGHVINHSGVLAAGEGHTSAADFQTLLGYKSTPDGMALLVIGNNGNIFTVGRYGTRSDVGTDAVTVNYLNNGVVADITDLARRLNALADSDDITLDQLSEIVAYIKSNKSLIDSITTSKVSVSDIVNNLTSTATNKPLSAAQGAVLKALIDAITVPTKTSQLDNDSGFLTSESDPTVPSWAKTPNKPSYTASEVGAFPSTGGIINGSTNVKSDSNTPLDISNNTDVSDVYLSFYRKGTLLGRIGVSELYSQNDFQIYLDGRGWFKLYHGGNKPKASDIEAGTFAGQVVANASGQTAGTSLLRNSKLVSADTNPTVNGEICWTYK